MRLYKYRGIIREIHGAKDVITQGNKILERSDVEDLN